MAGNIVLHRGHIVQLNGIYNRAKPIEDIEMPKPSLRIIRKPVESLNAKWLPGEMVKGSSIAEGSTFKTIKMEPAPTLEQWGYSQ